MPTTKVAIMRR